MRLWVLLSVTIPALTLAAVGLAHPHDLTPESAQWWTTMHVLLLPIFPLLGLAQWVLVRGPGILAWGARLAAFGYAVFYGALDAIAGIGTGTLVLNGVHAGGGHELGTTERAPEIGWLFGAGNELGTIGAWSFLVGSVLTAVVLFQRHGRMALPGGIVLIAASVMFLSSHIYWPTGVFTMLAMAVGFGLLAAAERRPTRAALTAT